MKILYIGSNTGNSFSLYESFEAMGIEIKLVNPDIFVAAESRLRRLLRIFFNKFINRFDKQPTNNPIMSGRGIRRLQRDRLYSLKSIKIISEQIRNIAAEFKPDLTVMFHNHYVDEAALTYCHSFGPIFCFFPDDAFTPERYTLRAAAAIKYIDCVMSTKSFNIPEFISIGIPVSIFVNNSYDPQHHYSEQVSEDDFLAFNCDVAFVGNNYIAHRADFLARLVESCPGVKFAIWGNYWSRLSRIHYLINPRRYLRYRKLRNFTRSPVSYAQIRKIHSASKINLGLLYAGDGPTRIRDYQTTRSVEIPASGGFMLAEYTEEHNSMFKEGQEAAYFHSFEDLVTKINYYLKNENERIQIAKAGMYRAHNSDYTFAHRAQTFISEYNKWCITNKRPLVLLE